MATRKPISVKKKTTRLIFFVSITVLLLSVVLLALVQGRYIFDEAKKDLAATSELLIVNSRLPLALGARDEIQDILDSVQAHKDIVTAYILRPGGEPLAYYFRTVGVNWRIDTADDLKLLQREEHQIKTGLRTGVEQSWFEAGFLSLFKPISFEGNPVGYIYLRSELTSLHKQILQLGLGWLLILGVAVILSYLLSLRLQRFISQPIDELVRQMRLISRDKNLSGFQAQTTQDEFVLLYQGLDEMLKALLERDRKLENHRQDLERQVSERTRELETAKASAELAAETKSRFLANMSHEIRTPMIGVLGMAELLRQSNLPAKEQRLAETIYHSGEALLTVLNDILDFSKIEAGRLTLLQVPFDLTKCLEDIVDLMQVNAQNKGLPLHLESQGDIPQFVIGDPGRLRQILLNLLGNAIKFTETGKVTLKVMAEPVAAQGLTNVCIEVIDTGVGIPQEMQARIFDAFDQGDNHPEQTAGGTGLGLAIVQQLISLMGGTIELESTTGKGSVFRIEMAMASAPQGLSVTIDRRSVDMGIAQTEHTQPVSSEELVNQVVPSRILLAEDNPTTQELLSILLQNEGHALAIVNNGLEALNFLERETVDLVFMDCQMPGLDGFEATRRLRASGVRTPVIALTAYARSVDEERCLDAGMDDFLSKPFRQKELKGILTKWLSSGPTANTAAGTGDQQGSLLP